MGKALQVAEERWAALKRGDAARRRGFIAAYIQGREDALPEEPDPAVIEAMTDVLMMWVGCNDTPLFGDRDDADYASRNLYAAMRGAMQ